MTRKYIDCREHPSESNCSVAICADSDQELMEAAVQHIVSIHQGEDNAELRNMIKESIKEGTPTIERPPVHA